MPNRQVSLLSQSATDFSASPVDNNRAGGWWRDIAESEDFRQHLMPHFF